MALQRGPRLRPNHSRRRRPDPRCSTRSWRDRGLRRGENQRRAPSKDPPRLDLRERKSHEGQVEINTFERSPAAPIVTRLLSVENAGFTGSADVPTFTLEELVATKIRALYQRRKGRDLFDLWLAIEHGGATPEGIAACFGPYWPDGWTTTLARENLDAKVEDQRFTTDLDPLVTDWPGGYSIDAGAQAASAVLDEIASAEHSN